MSEIAAGAFGAWLAQMRAVLRGEQDADVPCSDCRGCCVSSYPIPLRPTDQVALERVPARYLQMPAGPAAGLARMGFRDDGSCPMLEGGGCSIYRDRPQTCRDYDCRIYAAAGLVPAGDRPVILERIESWSFSYPSRQDRDEAAAVRRAAKFIGDHQERFPAAMRAGSPTAVAVLAIKCYGLFMQPDTAESGDSEVVALVAQIAAVARVFDGGK